MALRFFNTLGRKIELFTPLKEGQVGMYTCGPTVYDYPHIGNYRTFLFEDVLHRYLEFKGFVVKQVMNITDVEDKIIRACKQNHVSLKEYTQKYETAFFEDLDLLNVEKASVYPRATEHIADMVELVNTLRQKGFAYERQGSFYFSIASFPPYGKLNGIKAQDLKTGARVKSDEYSKEEARDFALWKAWDEEDGEVYWETQLGKGRPGWHIECSAMAMKYLGETFDIHTGGVDNKFPHHENEIAQSEAASGKQLARYWLHAEHLLVNGERMGKSLHNFVTLRDLVKKGFDPMAVRYFLISGHYGSQLNFTEENLKQALESVKRLREFRSRVSEIENEDRVSRSTNEVLSRSTQEMMADFESAMDDNLQMPKALATIFEFVKEANKELDSGRFSIVNREEVLSALARLDSVLGVLHRAQEQRSAELTQKERDLIQRREDARRRKDWKEADQIRLQLDEMGITLVDTPDGVRWRKRSPTRAH
jgi:cysteinyl-tRNA synthetase